MRKRSLVYILFIVSIILAGCGNTQKNNSGKSDKTNSKIIEFIKNKLSDSWKYSEEKLKLDDNHNVEIVFDNVEDWSYCAYSADSSILKLNKTNDDLLTKIPKITFICKNNNVITSKSVYESIPNINENNILQYAKYYDANDTQITENPIIGFKKSCKSYSYKEIFRNPDKYFRKKIKITGEVIQVMEEKQDNTDYWVLRVNMTKDSYGSYDDTIMVLVEKSSFKGRIIEDDIFTFYGIITDPITYETVLGSSQTVPGMLAIYADLIKE